MNQEEAGSRSQISAHSIVHPPEIMVPLLFVIVEKGSGTYATSPLLLYFCRLVYVHAVC